MMYTTPQQFVGKNSSGHSSNGITWTQNISSALHFLPECNDHPFINPSATFSPDHPLRLGRASDCVPERSLWWKTTWLPCHLWNFKASTRAPSFQMLLIMSSSVFTIHGTWESEKSCWKTSLHLSTLGFWPKHPCEWFVGEQKVILKEVALQDVLIPVEDKFPN